MNKVKTCLTLFVLALLSRPAAAQLTVTQSVFGSGGIPLQDGTRRINGTVGQQAIGVVSDASALHLVGFWYVPPLPVEPAHELTHYALLATRSLRVEKNAQVVSGNIGVLDYGEPSSAELVLGTRSSVADSVSAPRVEVGTQANVGGMIFYGEKLVLSKKATIGGQEQVDADFWPLFRLPGLRSGTPGSEDVEVKKNKTTALPAGAYGQAKVGKKGTLILEGGVYELASLEVGEHAAVRCQGPTTLLIDGRLSLDSRAWLAPAEGSGLQADDLQVHVAGGDREEGKKSTKSTTVAAVVGVQAECRALIYVPNGTLHLEQKSTCTGAFIARDVDIEGEVTLEGGWKSPRGFPVAAPKPVAAKPAIAEEISALPAAFGLDQNYPNPFNPSTTIGYRLAEVSVVELVIYNALGQEVARLVDQVQQPGDYRVAWDGRDDAGRPVGSGVYMYRLESAPHVQVRRMVVTK